MPTAPETPEFQGRRLAGLDHKFTLDARSAVPIAAALFCVGLIVGFKIRGAVPDVVQVPAKAAPCADCAEKAIQAERERMGTASQEPVVVHDEASGGIPGA